MSQNTDLLTPVGRLVAGNLYKPNEKDADGNPLLVKSGPNKGQPRVEYFFAIAIPKAGEQHWSQTAWGAKIWQTGHAAFPNQAQAPTFAWKVKDGDSAVPNRKGRKPCDNEGWAGCWVLFFSGGYAPKVLDAQGKNPIVEPDAVKPGYYVQVFGSVAGNGSQQQSGVFLNHNAVALSAYGPEIQQGRDYSEVGFGQGVQLPPGASAAPVAAMQPPAAPGSFQPPAPVAAPAAPVAAPVAPVAVAPNQAFLTPPAAPVAPPPAAVRQMTAKAAGATYEVFRANGWNDQQLVQEGYMLA